MGTKYYCKGYVSGGHTVGISYVSLILAYSRGQLRLNKVYHFV